MKGKLKLLIELAAIIVTLLFISGVDSIVNLILK